MNDSQKLYKIIQETDDVGEYRCVDCGWSERVEVYEMERPAGVFACPECGSDIRGYDEVLYAEGLHEFLKT